VADIRPCARTKIALVESRRHPYLINQTPSGSLVRALRVRTGILLLSTEGLRAYGGLIYEISRPSQNCRVYFQDARGRIRESLYSGVWTASNSVLFTAELFSPLTVIG